MASRSIVVDLDALGHYAATQRDHVRDIEHLAREVSRIRPAGKWAKSDSDELAVTELNRASEWLGTECKRIKKYVGLIRHAERVSREHGLFSAFYASILPVLYLHLPGGDSDQVGLETYTANVNVEVGVAVFDVGQGLSASWTELPDGRFEVTIFDRSKVGVGVEAGVDANGYGASAGVGASVTAEAGRVYVVDEDELLALLGMQAVSRVSPGGSGNSSMKLDLLEAALHKAGIDVPRAHKRITTVDAGVDAGTTLVWKDLAISPHITKTITETLSGPEKGYTATAYHLGVDGGLSVKVGGAGTLGGTITVVRDEHGRVVRIEQTAVRTGSVGIGHTEATDEDDDTKKPKRSFGAGVTGSVTTTETAVIDLEKNPLLRNDVAPYVDRPYLHLSKLDDLIEKYHVSTSATTSHATGAHVDVGGGLKAGVKAEIDVSISGEKSTVTSASTSYAP